MANNREKEIISRNYSLFFRAVLAKLRRTRPFYTGVLGIERTKWEAILCGNTSVMYILDRLHEYTGVDKAILEGRKEITFYDEYVEGYNEFGNNKELENAVKDLTRRLEEDYKLNNRFTLNVAEYNKHLIKFIKAMITFKYTNSKDTEDRRVELLIAAIDTCDFNTYKTANKEIFNRLESLIEKHYKLIQATKIIREYEL